MLAELTAEEADALKATIRQLELELAVKDELLERHQFKCERRRAQAREILDRIKE